MKIKIFKRFVFILLISCNQKELDVSALVHLNGYWKISHITQENEMFKPNGEPQLIDYYFFKQKKGVRKKVQPNLINQSFLVSLDEANFVIIEKQQNFFLSYKTKWATWEERIVTLDKDVLILENDAKEYHYVRHSK